MTLTIQIDSADFCRGCGRVFDGAESRRCPSCGSYETVPVLALMEPEHAAGLGEHTRPRRKEERPMNLSRAAVCAEESCQEVFDGREHDHCPVCGGRAAYPASRWIRPLWTATEKARPIDQTISQAVLAGGAHGPA